MESRRKMGENEILYKDESQITYDGVVLNHIFQPDFVRY